MSTSSASLHRTVNGPQLILYGVGTMLGAGIYALIGEVAGAAGQLAPAAFVVAAIIAGLTAASFAEFSSRYPRSAGEAVYVAEGFGSPSLAMIVGFLIVASGIVSSGVMFRGFIGYAEAFVSMPPWIGFVILTILVGGLAAWGIAQSLIAVVAITLAETAVLIFIIVLGLGANAAPPPVPVSGGEISGVIAGAVLAFYAFIGFEDMVNISEEVKEPRTTMPKAIFIAFAVTAAIYFLVALVAVRTTPVDALAASAEPMTLIFAQLSDLPSWWVNVIAMVAVINGALVQIVMASRVLYGLARHDMAPAWFGHVNAKTRTPVQSTIVVAAIVFIAATLLPLGTLAQATSFFLLVVFALVNLALIRVKRRGKGKSQHYEAPAIIPWLGAISAAGFAVFSLIEIFS